MILGPEPKAKVSYVVVVLVVLVVNFLHVFFSRTTWPISTKTDTRYPWMKWIQVCSNEGPRPFPRVDNNERAKKH